MTMLGRAMPDRNAATPPQAAPAAGGKDLLTVAAIPRACVVHLLNVARAMKAAPRSGRAATHLAGLTLGLVFEKPSTRTRVSFEAGMAQLGGHALFLPSDTSQLSRGESLADTAQVLSRYLDGLVVRTFEQSALEDWARHAAIPVINGLTDLCHPCQALADLLTIQEAKGALEGLKLAYVGDGNNIAHSLIEVGAKVGMRVSIGCPPAYQPDPGIVARSRDDATHTGAVIDITDDPAAAADGADVLYTDVWTSMGQEREQAERMKALAPYQVNDALLRRAKPSAVALHCLPAHRGQEITEAVLDGPQSLVLAQAENRLHMHKAILTEYLGRPWFPVEDGGTR